MFLIETPHSVKRYVINPLTILLKAAVKFLKLHGDVNHRHPLPLVQTVGLTLQSHSPVKNVIINIFGELSRCKSSQTAD